MLLVVVPALIVFGTAYYIMKEFTTNQWRTQSLRQQAERQKTTLPIRLQAYERLALFCERISITGLVLRTRAENMTPAQYKVNLLMSIQQEYEHNVTQQVYVSDQLWQIIQVARDDLSRFIDLVSQEMEPGASARDFADHLLNHAAQRERDPLQTAQTAIRKETASIF